MALSTQQQQQQPATPRLTAAADTHNMIDDMRDISLEDGQPNTARRHAAATNVTSPVDDPDDHHHGNNDVGLPPDLVLHRFTLPIRNVVPFDNNDNNDDDDDDDDEDNGNESTSMIPAAAVHDDNNDHDYDDDDAAMHDKDPDSDSEPENAAAGAHNADNHPATADPSTRLRALQAAAAFANATSKREVQLLLAGLPRDPATGVVAVALRHELRARGLKCSQKGWCVTYLADKGMAPRAGVPVTVEGERSDVDFFFDRRMGEVPEARRLVRERVAQKRAAKRVEAKRMEEKKAARGVRKVKRRKRNRKAGRAAAGGKVVVDGAESVVWTAAGGGTRASTRQCVVEARKQAVERAIQEGLARVVADDERKKASGYELR